MTFSAQICPKINFPVGISKNISPDPESAPPRYHVCQFSDKTDNFEFFGLNLGKLPNYMRYFGFNNVEGVAESWVEGEISWVEVDGAGWMRVHGLAVPNFKIILTHNEKFSLVKKNFDICKKKYA